MKRFTLVVIPLLMICSSLQAEGGLLTSWNDGPTKRAILDFVRQTTQEGTPDYVPPDERIVTFANDGTLWAQQPTYVQNLFAMDRVKALAPQHPEWKTQEPFNHLLEGDIKAFNAGGQNAILTALAAIHAGMTTDEFQNVVKDWLKTAKHPLTGRPYSQMVYQPMLELLAYLRSNGFRTYIVTRSGVEFVRAFAEQIYGIPPDQVIGTSCKLKYELRNRKIVLVRLPEVQFVNSNEGKVIAIQTIVGRRPIAAFGNSDGDLQVMEWTASGEGLRLVVLVHHDDSAREWAYDRKFEIDKLDLALDAAHLNRWTIVSMQYDWNTIFAGQ